MRIPSVHVSLASFDKNTALLELAISLAATTIPRGQSTRFWEATCHVVVGECHLCVSHVYKLYC